MPSPTITWPRSCKSKAILRAQDFATIEAHLVSGARKALGLTSACVFREDGGVFRRSACAEGWDEQAAKTLDPDDPILHRVRARRPFDIGADAVERNHLPGGPMRPVLAVPVADRRKAFPR